MGCLAYDKQNFKARMKKSNCSIPIYFTFCCLFFYYSAFNANEVNAFLSPTSSRQFQPLGVRSPLCTKPYQSLSRSLTINHSDNRNYPLLGEPIRSNNYKLHASGGGEDLDIRDRLGSALVYLLPVLDGINYGHFLFSYFPEVSRPIFSIINPILAVYKANTFIPLFCYLALIYVGRNSDLPRYTRFNIQQAVVLDVAIVLPGIILALLENAPLYVQEPISNLFFFCLVASVGYSWISIARGMRPNEIPIISQAAEMSVGPF